VVREHSEVAFVEGFVESVAVGYGVGSGVVCAEDSKARVLVAISLKTYTQTTLALTNNRPVGCGWMLILALHQALPLSLVAAVAAIAAASMRSPVNR
jgi:hypothetical protein